MIEITIGMKVKIRDDIQERNVVRITRNMYESRGSVLTVEGKSQLSDGTYAYFLSNGWHYIREWFDPLVDGLTLYDLVD